MISEAASVKAYTIAIGLMTFVIMLATFFPLVHPH
jgi:hypothetical protein